jgi:hypothetical protein
MGLASYTKQDARELQSQATTMLRLYRSDFDPWELGLGWKKSRQRSGKALANVVAHSTYTSSGDKLLSLDTWQT